MRLCSFYTSLAESWNFPILRRPRKTYKMTPAMREVQVNVQLFIQGENEYLKQGKPFRQGYLIQGDPGTGKSTIVEKVAHDFGMSTYLVTLNSNQMTDSTLINLIASVPPRSIILFDDFDQQYSTLFTNQNLNVSHGGILTALDGAHRLSYGTIIFMLLNNMEVLDSSFKEALVRPGRIDHQFKFVGSVNLIC